MNAATLREILAAAQSPDAAKRNAAEEQLRLSFTAHPAIHLSLLSRELADEASPTTTTRALAGLSLKNFFTSKDHTKAMALAKDWAVLSADVRDAIKTNSLAALTSSLREVRLSAAQVISKIATIELPKVDSMGHSAWDNLMPLLLHLVASPEPGPRGMEQREAALHTVGYICEEIAQLETDCLLSKSDAILTAVVAGMRVDLSELSVKLAATNALCNALAFAHRNFQVDAERNYVMSVICEACVSANDEVKELAYQCLGRVAELYYDKLTEYIQTLLEITLQAIETEADAVARQAIAFWSAVCETELDLVESGETGQYKKFIHGAAKFLVPHLLRAMTTQEDGQDEDTLNRSTEAAVCLAATATLVQNEILGLVVPFVRENIASPDWRLREASIVAFGSVLDGPYPTLLGECVGSVLDALVSYLQDPQDLIKNSAAWAINRICEFVPSTIAPPLVGPLCQKISDALPNSVPATAGQLCWALYHLATYYRPQDPPGSVPAHALSSSYMLLCKALIDTGDRSDATEANLRATAYEAMNAVLSVADTDNARTVIATTMLPLLGDRLNQTFAMPLLNADDVHTKSEWQACYCSALETCIHQIPVETLAALDESGMTVADRLMHLFLQVCAAQSTHATQEAILAVSCLCCVIPDGAFDRYMQSFGPVLVTCIAAVQEPQICWLAVQATTDIARSLDRRMIAYADTIVEALLGVLANAEVDSQIHQVRDYVKPHVYVCLGEIALAIGEGIGKYLPLWLNALQQGIQVAAQTKGLLAQDPNHYDEDLRIYQDTLCEGLLQAYVGIVHGLKVAELTTPGAIESLRANPLGVQGGCLLLMQTLADDDEKSEAVLKSAVSLIGDLAETYGELIAGDLQHYAVLSLVAQAKDASDKETRGMGVWAAKKMHS